jgi:putative acetyltransferase
MTAMRKILVRRAVAADAAALCFCMAKIAKESNNLLYETSEIPNPKAIEKFVGNESLTSVFIAIRDSGIIGYATLNRGGFGRNKGVTNLAMAVLSDCHNIGVGSKIMNKVITHCRWSGIHRIELRVSAANESAIRLYKRFSFEVEGVAKAAAIVDGNVIDKIMMAKLLI